jgi:hypothetical protein
MIDKKFKQLLEEFVYSQDNDDYKIKTFTNKKSDAEKIELLKDLPHNIMWYENPTEEMQIESVRNFDYNYFDDDFVDRYITSQKAYDLYCRLKKVRDLIK